MLHSWDLVKRSEIKWSGLGITFENAVLHAVVLHFLINALIARFQSFNKVPFNMKAVKLVTGSHWNNRFNWLKGLMSWHYFQRLLACRYLNFPFWKLILSLWALQKVHLTNSHNPINMQNPGQLTFPRLFWWHDVIAVTFVVEIHLMGILQAHC